MSEQTLASLAVLTVNWERGHDLIESFVPLVADCVRQNGDQPVSLVALQQAVAEESGITIPTGALQAIVGRCAKRGFVERRDRVFYPKRDKLDELDYAPAREEALRQHGSLLTRLRDFAKERYGLDWSEEDANRHLLAFLQVGSVPVLAAAADGDPLPTDGREQSAKAKHVLSAFAGHLSEKDSGGFSCLETVVKGHILSGVLFYPDLGAVETRFGELDVYCDTPFILRALGYSEEGIRLLCVDLIDLLRDLGANLKCFHHTREEVVGVLEATAASLRAGVPPSPGPEHTMSRQFTSREVEEMIVKIDQTLGGFDIEVVDTPDFTEQPDEVALGETLQEKIVYSRGSTRAKDVQSLAAVARLRGLRRMDKFESSKAIFVTTNTTLAWASSEFFRGHGIEGPGAIPLCMPADTMTRLAWVKKPMVAPDLPKHVVMAAAYAALNPSPALWRKYLTEIERRRNAGEITDEEYHLLRSSLEARAALMDKTFGEEQAFSAGTLDEVLAYAREAVQAEERARTEEERERRLEAEELARTERGRRERMEGAHRGRIARRARRLGKVVGWGAAAVLAVALIIGFVATIPGVPLVEVDGFWRILIWICIAGFAAISVWALMVKGVAVRDIRRQLSARVEGWWSARGHRKLEKLHSEPPGNG